MTESNEQLYQSIPKKWERLNDLILFPKDAFLGEEWFAIMSNTMTSSNELLML